MNRTRSRRRGTETAPLGRRFSPALLALAGLVALAVSPSGATDAVSGHGAAMHGAPKYGPDFEHFEYVNPDAPKGGTLRLAAIGTYDSLNPFITKGVTAAGLGLLFDTLMTSSRDEAFSQYGLLAERIAFPADRSWVEFTLRAEARWHDGAPVTVDDVIFSFETLRADGRPHYRFYYADVVRTEKRGERTIRFVFAGSENRELPLILGELPIISKAYYETNEFKKTTLEPPPGHGPYKIETLDIGRSITYRRDPNYWGANLPVNRGRWNFDEIQYEYYRDQTVAIEAFKSFEYDARVENSAKEWATSYTGPQFDEGRAIRERIRHEVPTGMQGFVFNLRRPMFRDRRVREALGYVFDFEWANRTLFYGAYTRTTSYFSNSELASSGLPSAAELALLEPFRDRLPPELFAQPFTVPTTDGSGNIRRQLRKAIALLDEAGWRIVDGTRRNPETGEPLDIEFLFVQPSFERVGQPMVANLEKLGIKARLRTVDTSQYQNRIDEYDFDVVISSFPQSLSPGNEQRDYWGSEAADQPGGRNLIGLKDPVIDALVDAVIRAPDREGLVTATHALDRVLLWGHYVIPQFHVRAYRVVRWNKFGRPAKKPRYSLGLVDTWWIDEAKQAALDKGGGGDASPAEAPSS